MGIVPAVAAGLFFAAGAVLPPALAQANSPFGGFGYEEDSKPRTTDRAFIKEWEGNPPPGFATLSPANLDATKEAIRKYSEIVDRGGWPSVPEVRVRPGDSHFVVSVLRQRLASSGEYRGDVNAGETFDGELEDAVKRFQATSGLTPTGVVDERTAAALNIPADARLKQLKVNLTRLTEMVGVTKKHEKYVIVNIPAAHIEAVEKGQVVSRHTGVVGKPDRPTPLLRSTITDLNFNPVWRLPPTVITKDLIPAGRAMQAEGQNILVKMKVDAYGPNGKKLDPLEVDFNSSAVNGYSYSQQPGKDNPLGFLKINFASAESVYMHDTPKDGLFGRNFRADSSGCIRVNNIALLAEWLLRGNPGWSGEVIQKLRTSGERRDIRLKAPVPLYFVYITAWATEDGVIQFRRDLYNRDGAGEMAAAY
jgi:murein L,D-transpeptidase YcbB/YkuD